MNRIGWIGRLILAILFLIGTAASASDPKLPVIKGKKTVAMVGGEPITWDELEQELAPPEGGVDKKKPTKEETSQTLDRLINATLIVQEARRMGIDQLPELRKEMDAFERVTLREELIERHVKTVRADEKEVEKIFKELVKEWKIKSIVFEKEENAKKMQDALTSGKGFDETQKKFLADKTGKGSEEGKYLRARDLFPEIVDVVSKMKVGAISPIIPMKSGFVILRLDDIRFPENPGAKDQARREALETQQIKSLRAYEKMLREKYTRVRRDVLDRIDFESKEPGFEKLLNDKRVVVEVKGEAPITVGDLAQSIRQQLYHGVDRAVESKKLNSRKDETLDDIVHRRVFRKEALRLGLDKTQSYKNKVKEKEHSLIFSTFVQKVVAPDIKLNEEELKAYHNDHTKEFNTPEMMRVRGLVFSERQDAEETLEKLRKGSDFRWLQANTERQVDKNTQGFLDFDGKLITVRDLPGGVQKAITGARAGDFRLYASPQGHFYALSVQEVVPSKPQPYNEVRESIAKKVYDDKLKKTFEQYATKLRTLSEVKIYLK
jgi:parvulin-like peptidyl-prolyl isomerase